MIVIREAGGRYEVVSPGRHWEMFEGRLGAQAAALALAGEIQRESGVRPKIVSPWPVCPDQRSPIASS